jgi:uncharacterized protein (DUF433 family)
MDWREFITVDPAVCHGRACVKGTRVTVSVVLDNLAAGASIGEIVADYPGISSDAVKAVMAFAADLARERFVALP